MLGNFHRRALLFAVILMAAVCFPSQAQERRVIPVSVVDKDGNIVEGLTAKNFRGKFRGKEVIMLSARLDTGPRRIAVLVDTSTSMKDFPKVYSAAWNAAHDTASKLSKSHSVSLFTFAEKLKQEIGFGAKSEELSEKIINLANNQSSHKGKTALFNAIQDVFTHIDEQSFGLVVYVITDADSNKGNSNLDHIARIASEWGARLYFVCLPSYKMVDVGFYATNSCRQLAELTGGIAYSAVTRLDVAGSTLAGLHHHAGEILSVERVLTENRKLLSSMETVYRMEIEIPRRVDKPRKWKLEVVDERGKKMKGVKIYYPRLLVPLEKEQDEK